MTTEMTGGCACGRIRYTVRVENDQAYLCHCRMCQRASGNVSLALKTVKAADVRWEREPEHYHSSPIARRGYCSECGTSLTFQYLDNTDKMDLTVGSFDAPEELKPLHHFGAESMHRAWLNTEGLPEHRSDEYEPLNKRWLDSVGKLPD